MKFLSSLLLLISVKASSQQVIYNLNYSTGKDTMQQMDLYTPKTNTPFPTIVFLHEGGLTGGDKRENNLPLIAQKFQSDGIGFVLVNYRLSPTPWPAEPDDACEAFAWIKKNVSKYGGDNNRVFIAGHSSGAFLTALVSTDAKYMEKQGLNLHSIAGSIVIGTQLTANLPAVAEEKLAAFFENNPYLKIFGNRQIFEDASPALHINVNIPAMRFIIAEAEQLNPPILAQTEAFVSKAKAYNPNISYHVIPERRHITNVTKMPEAGDPVYQLIKDFVTGTK